MCKTELNRFVVSPNVVGRIINRIFQRFRAAVCNLSWGMHTGQCFRPRLRYGDEPLRPPNESRFQRKFGLPPNSLARKM